MTPSTVPYALVVDDNPLVLLHAQTILEDAGFRTHEALSGDAAIELLNRVGDSVTLLFSDVEMPGATNGFALARHVAEHWPGIEIVIASGQLKPGPMDLPEKATFISKPFDGETVHDHLRMALPDGKQPEPLRSAV